MHLLLLSPPSAVTAYPKGVRAKASSLDVTGPVNLSLLPQAPREQLQDAFRNDAVPQKKAECLHGAPRPGAAGGAVDTVGALLQAPVAALGTRLARSLVAAARDLRVVRILVSMAVDAALEEDEEPLVHIATVVALLLGTVASHTPAEQEAACAEVGRSGWHARRFVAGRATCSCLAHGRFTAMCALPGCGKVHWGATRLRQCGCEQGVFYCGTAHQNADWAAHQAVCRPCP